MEKDIETLKGNTKSEANIEVLDKMEKSLDKVNNTISDFMAHTWDTLTPRTEEHHDPTPVTPEVTVPSAIKYTYVRKPGGRIVKRQLKEGAK